MISIPFTTGLDAFTEIVDLDDQSYLIGFAWNNREAAWYMSVATLEEVDIVTGIKLVMGMELLQRTARAGIPPGEIYAVAITPTDTITKDSIPAQVEIVYIPKAEL